uniref:Uncharacterized protein n=1 Tax=Hucho hucho TaxID=62062 RepID=A0A4W5K6B2_9TELE
MLATFTLNIFRSVINYNKWGSFQLPGLLNFGEFKCSGGDKKCHLWTVVDLAFFVLMGVVGGAFFHYINKRLAKYHMRHVHPKAKFVRVLESLLVAMVTTVVIFVACMTLGECRDLASLANQQQQNSAGVTQRRRHHLHHPPVLLSHQDVQRHGHSVLQLTGSGHPPTFPPGRASSRVRVTLTFGRGAVFIGCVCLRYIVYGPNNKYVI